MDFAQVSSDDDGSEFSQHKHRPVPAYDGHVNPFTLPHDASNMRATMDFSNFGPSDNLTHKPCTSLRDTQPFINKMLIFEKPRTPNHVLSAMYSYPQAPEFSNSSFIQGIGMDTPYSQVLNVGSPSDVGSAAGSLLLERHPLHTKAQVNNGVLDTGDILSRGGPYAGHLVGSGGAWAFSQGCSHATLNTEKMSNGYFGNRDAVLPLSPNGPIDDMILKGWPFPVPINGIQNPSHRPMAEGHALGEVMGGFQDALVQSPVHTPTGNSAVWSISRGYLDSERGYLSEQYPSPKERNSTKITSHNRPLTNHIRSIGSCKLCSLKKRGCSETRPCQTCKEDYPDETLRFCESRITTLYDVRKRENDPYNLSKRKSVAIPSEDTALTHALTLTHSIQKQDDRVLYWSNAPTINVQIQCYESPLNSNLVTDGEVQQHNGNASAAHSYSLSSLEFGSKPAQLSQYFIIPSTLPRFGELIQWESSHRRLHTLTDIETTYDIFLGNCGQHLTSPKHTNILSEVLSLVSLHRILYSCRPVNFDAQQLWLSHHGFLHDGIQSGRPSHKQIFPKDLEEIENSTKLPEPANTQLLSHLVKGVQDSELRTFEQLDRLIREVEKREIKRGDLLVLAVCLRRIALLYRNGLLRNDKSDEPFYAKRQYNQKMFDHLTRCYASIFWKTPSPFHKEWKLSADSLVLKDHPLLAEKFEAVYEAEIHHAQYEVDEKVDKVYTELILQRRHMSFEPLSKQWAHNMLPSSRSF
ncbi:hypothetical protein F5Y19DRAFT_490504 [Xylariaceae sp. FL1651]|nr:hypothetical protein F5Y19DRAFT_490504 [Xylariaceae sp. FL1651]